MSLVNGEKKKKSYFFEDTGNRFLEGDIPTEIVYRNFVESLPFSSEETSRAMPYLPLSPLKDLQGLVSLARDTDILSRREQTSGVSLVVSPHQVTECAPNVSETVGDFTGVVMDVTVDPSVNTHFKYLIRLSDEFNTYIESLGSSGIDWSNNIVDATPVNAVKDNGYTAESGGITNLVLPDNTSITPPSNGDRIGASSDSSSIMSVTLEGGSNYISLTPNQSIIIRWDSSKSAWLIVSSYLPSDVTTSDNFYVDKFAPDNGDGSVTFPFNNLISARDAVIGSGTAILPENEGVIINVTSGQFTVTNNNLYIEGTSWNFSEGVSIVHTGTGYLFDNSITPENIVSLKVGYILGEVEYSTSSPSCGFIFSKPVDSNTGTSASNRGRKIEASFKSAINTHDPAFSTTTAIPVIKSEGLNTSTNGSINDGTYSLVLSFTQLSAYFCTGILYLGAGSRTEVLSGAVSGIFSGNNNSNKKTLNHAIFIDNVYQTILKDYVSVGLSEGDYVIPISGVCGFIKLESVMFSLGGSSNPAFQREAIIRVMDTYSYFNKNSNGRSVSGIEITKCSTSSNNYLSGGDESFIVHESGAIFTANLSENNLDGKYPTNIVMGYYLGNTLVQSFVKNVLGYSTGGVLKKSLVYSNIPTTPTGLPAGSIYSSGGVITIV